MSKKYIQVEVNPSSIDLDPINKTCKISASFIKKEFSINDIATDPAEWSRDNLVKQFGLLTSYPWFWKQSLKDSINKADDVTPICKVKPVGYDEAVDIKDLKHFNDVQGGVGAKLKFSHNIEGIIKFASDQRDNVHSLSSSTDPVIPLPEFRRDAEGKLRLDCPVRFYKEWVENGVTKQSDDITGFYYRASAHKDYAITTDALFVFEARVPSAVGVNTYNVDKYIANKSQFITNYTWPPKVNDLVLVTDEELGEDLYGTVTKITNGNLFEIKLPSMNNEKIVTNISVSGQQYTMKTLDFRKNVLWDSKLNGNLSVKQTIKSQNITKSVGDKTTFRVFKPNSVEEPDPNGGASTYRNPTWADEEGNLWVTGKVTAVNTPTTDNYTIEVGTPAIVNSELVFYNDQNTMPITLTHDGTSFSELDIVSVKPAVGTELYVLRDLMAHMNPTTPFYKGSFPGNTGTDPMQPPTDWTGADNYLGAASNFEKGGVTKAYVKCVVKTKTSFLPTGTTELKYKYTVQLVTSGLADASKDGKTYVEFTSISNEEIVAPQALGGERQEVIGSGPIPDEVQNQQTAPKVPLSAIYKSTRVGQQIIYDNNYAAGKESYDKKAYYELYTIYPENQVENVNVINTTNSRKLFVANEYLYPNDGLLKPGLVTTHADMQYGDLTRMDVDPAMGNSTPYGYFRLVFKAKKMDLPMLIRKPADGNTPASKKESSLTVEQTGDKGTDMYGFMASLRYVYSPKDKFVDSGNSLDYGENMVSKLMNVHFRHSYNPVKPYDFVYGISMKEGTTANTIDGATLVFPSGLDATKKTKAIEKILARAKNFCNYVAPTTAAPTPTGKDANNLYEYYGQISRGHYHKESHITMYKIPPKGTGYDIPLKRNAANSHIIDNKHVKLAQILIVDKAWTLTSKLINCGIIIIKSGGTLTIDNNSSVSLINNGIIVCLQGGSIVDAGNRLKHAVTESKSNIIDVYSETADVTALQYKMHSCILPADTLTMKASFDINYTSKTDAIMSDKSCIFVSTNASTFTMPLWDDSLKKFNFEMTAPILAFSGTLAEPFYNFFVPDYLINKWFNTTRKSIEDSIADTNSNKGLKLYRKDTNTGQLVLQKLATDNITNFSMGGLLCKMDIHGVTW